MMINIMMYPAIIDLGRGSVIRGQNDTEPGLKGSRCNVAKVSKKRSFAVSTFQVLLQKKKRVKRKKSEQENVYMWAAKFNEIAAVGLDARQGMDLPSTHIPITSYPSPINL